MPQLEAAVDARIALEIERNGGKRNIRNAKSAIHFRI
jgi:hypothetical protein